MMHQLSSHVPGYCGRFTILRGWFTPHEWSRTTCPLYVAAVILLLASLALPSLAADAELRLLSYNIHHGEGLDQKLDLERIAKFIGEQKPDVVALQEVDQGARRTGGVKQADELARLTGMKAFFAKFMDFEGGEYGMALLTKLPIIEQKRIELPPGTEPRSSAAITVQSPLGEVTIADIHFYRTATERLAQAQALASGITNESRPVICIGDFNSQRGDPVMSWIEKEFAIPEKQGRRETFPANNPQREIDFAIFRPRTAFEVKEYRVLDESVFSDHRAFLIVLTRKEARRALLPDTRRSPQAVRELEAWLKTPRDERTDLKQAQFSAVPLSRDDAAAALAMLWQDHVAFVRETRAAEMRDKVIELGELRMKFDWVRFTDTNSPATNRPSLFLSLHGGGGTRTSVNDSQWRNQLRLGNSYRPAEGIYVAPRAPTDTWNLWHQAHIDAFFDRLIENLVVFENVDPNRAYVLGYSAGGDGVYQLAPRMADRWAAASMMAGHPNEASPLGLRNVPFAIQVGANDRPYRRNEVALEWGAKLAKLREDDAGGYVHFVEAHAGKGHWMDLADRKAIPWMEQFTRDPLPARVVWFQDDVTHTRFYWLARPAAEVKAGQELVAQREGQTVTLSSTSSGSAMVLLNDAMLDLDQPVVVRVGDQLALSNRVTRTIATLAGTLSERGDTNLAFSAAVTVCLP